MAANRTTYILNWVRGVLDDEATFRVVKVWRGDFDDEKVLVYPFILNTAFTDFDEAGYGVGNGVMTLNVLFHSKCGGDTDATGNNTDEYARIVAATEYLIDNVDLPTSETHTGNVYKTWIQSARVTGWDGQFDVGDTKTVTACTIEVRFAHRFV